MTEYISNSDKETAKIATDLVADIKGGEVIALSGNLGVGKTVFVKALAKAMGIEKNITSPTFVLMKVYSVDYKNIDKFVHVDCYRLRGQEDLFEIGLGDYLSYDNIIVAVEWADKVHNLPASAIRVHIDLLEGDKRKINIS
ncbi:tRNA (adenosine(37)-N6)-threonylcarbamoyltransferase complex ATPase subunit type 1 TsaE [bacterium]|nr:tRNA (adenosine(37)-N6)-threonylcarbamoyltransferase complex ATPase subunit type 1 TsaE [bacterium]